MENDGLRDSNKDDLLEMEEIEIMQVEDDENSVFKITYSIKDDCLYFHAIEVNKEADKGSELKALVVPFFFEAKFTKEDMADENHWWNACEDIKEIGSCVKNLFKNKDLVKLEKEEDYKWLKLKFMLKFFEEEPQEFSFKLIQQFYEDKEGNIQKLFNKQKDLFKYIWGFEKKKSN